MHHRPTGPPLSARLAGALHRGAARTRRSVRRPGRRLALGTTLSAAVTGFVLAMPVVSSESGTSPLSLDSSSSSAARFAEESLPVGTGADGLPAPSSTAAVAPAPEAAVAPPADLPGTPESPIAVADVPASTAPSPPASTAAASSAGAPGTEAEVLALVNTARAGAGCAALVHDEGLATVARAHSADMRDRAFFDHVNPDGLDPFERSEAAAQTNARAENIAYGQPTPAEVMVDFMDSTGHRANILDCGLRTLGVGVAEGPAGPWWTQLFGD